MLAALVCSCALWQGGESSDVIESYSTCKTKASRNQNWKVKMPALLVADIGSNCDREDHGVDHDSVCTQCGALHDPCGGKFVGCQGCDPNREETKDVPTGIDCNVLVEWIIKENSCQVAQVAAEENSNSTADPVYVVDKVQIVDDSTVVQGSVKTLVSGCSLAVGDEFWGKLPKLPVLFYFQCQQCNKGSPQLLKDCCDECVAFSQSALVSDAGMHGFTVCTGCDATQIEGMDTTWKYAGEFDTFSEERARGSLNTWVRQNNPAGCASDRRLQNQKETEKVSRSRRLVEEECDLTGKWKARGRSSGVRATPACLVVGTILAMMS